MATITANTGSNNWNTNAAWVGGVQPTAANDVVIPSGATVTIASATTALCRSCTNQSGGTIAFAATTSNLNIGDATAGTGNVAFSNAGTITLTAIGTINFVSTSATQQTILTSGSTMPNITFNGAGSSYLQSDAITATGAVCTLTAGTWATGGLSVSASSVTTGAGTKTWTPGASTITVSGSVTALGMGTTNITFTANTAVVVFSNAGVAGSTICTCFSGSMNGMSLVFSALGAGNINLNGGTTGNLVIVGATNKTAAATLVANGTVTGTVALQGNSVTNRLLVQSSTLGTARTITCNGSTTASVTLAGTTYVSQWADFMDITGAGTASWDLTQAGAATATFGDCQGNSTGTTMTLTPATTQTNTGATGNWSDATQWTSRVPLPQDNVVINTGSGTITADMPRLGANVDFTGFGGTYGYGLSPTTFGNWKAAAGMTMGLQGTLVLGGRGSQSITSAGKIVAAGITVNAPTGTYTQQDALTTTNNNSAINAGTYAANGFNYTSGNWTAAAATTTNMGSGTWTLLRVAAGNLWSMSGTGTVTGTATIVINGPTSNSLTFAGGGKTYGTLQYTVPGSPGPLAVTGATPTFANIIVTAAGTAPKTLTLPAGTTTTVTGTLTLTGTQVSGSVYLPGITASYIYAVDSAGTQLTGNLDARVLVSLDATQPVAEVVLVGKWGGSVATDSWLFSAITSSSKLRLRTGSGLTTSNSDSTVAVTGLFGGGQIWLRVTCDFAGNTTTFYTSPDGVTWAPLGGTGIAPTNALAAAAGIPLSLGAFGSAVATGNNLMAAGKFYKAQILNGIGGTVVASPDFTTTATGLEASYTDGQHNVWTVNGAVNGLAYLNSSTGGTRANLSAGASVGIWPVVLASIADSAASGGATFSATQSNLSNTTGWTSPALQSATDIVGMSNGVSQAVKTSANF